MMNTQYNSEPLDPPSSGDARLFLEQIRTLQEQSRIGVLLNLPLVVISAVILWPAAPTKPLLVWTAVLIILSVLRLAMYRNFRSMVKSEACVQRWARLHQVATAITGVAWGSMGYFLDLDLSPYQANYIALVFLGLTATSLSVNASYFPNFLAFFVPICLTMESFFLSTEQPLYHGFSYLLVFYFLILVKAAHSTAKNLRHTISLKHENQDLISHLRQSNSELTREIELRSSIESQLRDAKDIAEQASQSKSEFISRISHELRTPLTAILGFSGILGHSPKVDEAVRTDIIKINKAGQHLLGLIEDLLDISRIESGTLSVTSEPVRLEDLLEETRNLILPLAKRSSIDLQIDIPAGQLVLQADYMRLKQVLLNLLTNAVKYNHGGGRVSLSTETLDEDKLRIHVTDNGAGIAADKLDQIFMPYNRLGAEYTQVSGTGIGMTISKQIIELMHGNIGVESELGKGSHFWVDLPLASEWDISGINDLDFLIDGLYQVLPDDFVCLYIEDNPHNVALIRRMMEHMGNIKLISAPTAELGIELAKAHQPDLILMDINLPGMDGYMALEVLRRDESNARLPIIALSANAALEEVERGLSAGFDDYLTKPVDMESLAASIARNYQNTTKRAASPSA